MIKIENLSFSYRYRHEKHKVLKDIHLKVNKGENIGLIGANGVGKSTFLKILVGLLDQWEGSVEIAGLPMEPKHLKEIRQKVGYVFQDSDHQLFMNTVYDDVAFAPRNYGYTEEQVKESVEAALAKVNLLGLKDRQIYRLSGGEKKLAAIATVLSMGADLILFDEPSVALDPRNRRNLIRVLNDLPQGKIIASHDLDFIYDTCERTILMWDGLIIADGPTKEILSDKKMLEDFELELPLRLQKRM